MNRCSILRGLLLTENASRAKSLWETSKTSVDEGTLANQFILKALLSFPFKLHPGFTLRGVAFYRCDGKGWKQ